MLKASLLVLALGLTYVAAAPSVLYPRNKHDGDGKKFDGNKPPPPPPFTPPGGIGLNETPQYIPFSDFDFQSLNLALNQEWIELDLFHYGLARFSVEDFEAAGLNAEDRFLIQFMADQEVGHATLISNMLQGRGAKQCRYQYPFQTVREFVDFCQKLTRFGESGVYGFLEHLDSRAAATLLLDSITTEARQQMIFRQFEGLFPMPVWFETGISQSMAWTLLAPYLVECPAENPRIEWQNFPALTITNNPDATPYVDNNVPGEDTTPAITHNRSEPLSFPGRTVEFTWESPGKTVSYNNSYTTSSSAGAPQFVAWISQLNTTYTPLENIQGNSGSTIQPGGRVFGDNTAPIVNGTMFVAIVDTDLYVTPFNLSKLNPHIVAGPALYQSG
ncbi:Rds1 protein [Coprinopsis cinerea okayama7|uniref:Rds1 protein n=1 Tax=Coprinopsis cinerea (strain Okayama-7 / 130 / ATCC MYA-4618 / FGSC 9003) TaxID=240176 RepID=A8P429_COPC7|nr:Rds1 protein [Coprinopsis cinerea okayama7\|eukprot:XP_001838665.1 Rds1 protein [Coprinopsis cinerea okayama7\